MFIIFVDFILKILLDGILKLIINNSGRKQKQILHRLRNLQAFRFPIGILKRYSKAKYENTQLILNLLFIFKLFNISIIEMFILENANHFFPESLSDAPKWYIVFSSIIKNWSYAFSNFFILILGY